MLESFRIKNFKSIVDTEINLLYAEGKAPNGYKKMERLPFLQDEHAKHRVVPVLAVYGQNASGKSTLCDAMSEFLEWINGDVCDYQPNKLHPELTIYGTEYSIVFHTDGDKFCYNLIVDEGGVFSERFEYNGKLIFEIHNAKIRDIHELCSDEYPLERLNRIAEVECHAEGGTRSLLYVLGSRYTNLSKPVAIAYEYLTKKISFYYRLGFKHGINFAYLRKIRHWEEIGILDEISKYIRMLDIDIKEIKKRKAKFEVHGDDKLRDYIIRNKLDLELVTIHEDINGNMVELGMDDESDGTNALFELIGHIIATLKTGGIMIVDELDRSLHPLLLCKLLDFFTSRRYNINNAQIVFTAHNMEPLDGNLLRASEIGIVTKNRKSGSLLKRVSDFDGVRNVKNFRRGYLEGMFSGIPFPYL